MGHNARIEGNNFTFIHLVSELDRKSFPTNIVGYEELYFYQTLIRCLNGKSSITDLSKLFIISSAENSGVIPTYSPAESGIKTVLRKLISQVCGQEEYADTLSSLLLKLQEAEQVSEKVVDILYGRTVILNSTYPTNTFIGQYLGSSKVNNYQFKEYTYSRVRYFIKSIELSNFWGENEFACAVISIPQEARNQDFVSHLRQFTDYPDNFIARTKLLQHINEIFQTDSPDLVFSRAIEIQEEIKQVLFRQNLSRFQNFAIELNNEVINTKKCSQEFAELAQRIITANEIILQAVNINSSDEFRSLLGDEFERFFATYYKLKKNELKIASELLKKHDLFKFFFSTDPNGPMIA